MYMAIPLCTNFCMYKRINKKNCATILIKKETKILCIIFYLILKYICQLLFFIFYNKKHNCDYIIIYLLTLYSTMMFCFFLAYSKLCVSVYLCFGFLVLLYKPGTSERAILSCTPYQIPHFFLETDPCVCVRVYVFNCRWPCQLM